MSAKRTGQMSFADALLPDRARPGRLDRLLALVDWSGFEARLAGFRDRGPGRPGYEPLVMFKALLLQSLYGLSDAGLEEALANRLSFRRFVGLALADGVPDHATLCRFRLRLIEAGCLKELFAELDRQLDAAGLMLKRGTMLDATLIDTQASEPPSRDGRVTDPDARYARRSGKPGYCFGYKAHVGVDEGSGLIRSVLTTPANINDTTPADALVRGDERAVWADAAYHTHARAAALRARGVKARLARRPNKHNPELRSQKRYNRLVARTRSGVETTFATWKRRMGLTAIRYIGLLKASAQVTLAAIAFNMRRWVALAPA
ncbi:IS5 family transposase [Enterovirga sp. CN4-39]|uniref:IS5 family transposase n=1 Tax=Enterovirga sp. CN4-39 TaxID=3400910 RepID=UPI003C11BE2A